tara:strand:- start:560 stop:835 length:276 start_codon:yes stop_codon:yes gene_type:complete
MSVSKAEISKKISSELNINIKDCKLFLDSLLELIKKESQNKTVKLNNFGIFYLHKTPKRLGRNPKTKESYIIQARKKINFTSSIKVKKEIN